MKKWKWEKRKWYKTWEGKESRQQEEGHAGTDI